MIEAKAFLQVGRGPRAISYTAAPRQPVEGGAWPRASDVLFDIDWQGHTADRSGDAGRHRAGLRSAADDGRASRPARTPRRGRRRTSSGAGLANARNEIRHWEEYEYVIVNEDLQKSLTTARTILRAERQKRCRQPGLKRRFAACFARPAARLSSPALRRRLAEGDEPSDIDLLGALRRLDAGGSSRASGRGSTPR